MNITSTIADIYNVGDESVTLRVFTWGWHDDQLVDFLEQEEMFLNVEDAIAWADQQGWLGNPEYNITVEDDHGIVDVTEQWMEKAR